MLAQRYKLGLLAILLGAAALAAYGVYDQQSRRAALAGDLNIPRLPQSAQIVHCESPPGVITDVIYKCVVDISNNDFPQLLRGYKYNHYGKTYEAWPKQFKYGGRVSIEHNSPATQATIDVYIE